MAILWTLITLREGIPLHFLREFNQYLTEHQLYAEPSM